MNLTIYKLANDTLLVSDLTRNEQISILQTIVHSYGEFMAGMGGNKSVMSSFPPLPPITAESVVGTRDLSDDNDYLFAPTNSSSGSGATPV